MSNPIKETILQMFTLMYLKDKFKMENTIIAIHGRAKQGKSRTIRGIFNELIQNNGAIILNDIEPILNGDIRVILRIGEIRIGIESEGDPNGRSLDSIPAFVNLGCNIILCASRTSGETVDIINRTSRNDNYRLIWSTNHRSNNVDQVRLNEMSVNQLTFLLMSVINGVI